MGLDGISVNQLRVTPENNSSELNRVPKFTLEGEPRPVDELSVGQKVDPDKEKEREKRELAPKYDLKEDDSENEENTQEEQEETIKYDLSDKNKYILKVNDEDQSIVIIEKSTNNIIQKIDAENLSAFVNFLSNPQGSLINRKF